MKSPRTGAVILTTQSLPCSRSCCDLNHSLRMRLSLLRSTALDKSRLGTISPKRARLGAADLMITFEQRPRTDRPSFMASVKSAPLREPRKGIESPEPTELRRYVSSSDSQAGTTFGPACADYCPATPGFHPLQKAVRPLPANH